MSTPATLTLGGDLDEAAEHLADTGPGRAVLATIPDHDKPAAPTDRDGVHLNRGIWIITAVVS